MIKYTTVYLTIPLLDIEVVVDFFTVTNSAMPCVSEYVLQNE